MRDQVLVTCPLCTAKFYLPEGYAIDPLGCPGCWRVVNLASLWPKPTESWSRLPTIARVRIWGASWRRPPDPKVSAGFLDTQQWALDYNPTRDSDGYSLALEYAEKRYDEMRELSDVLDKKLDDIARTSLAVGVLIATAAKVMESASTFGRSPLLPWAVSFFALSMLVAVWSRSPTLYGTPMEIRDLLKVMDDHPELPQGKMEAVVASSYQVAVIASAATSEWKARQLWRATFLPLVGIVLLIVMLVTSGPTKSLPREADKMTAQLL